MSILLQVAIPLLAAAVIIAIICLLRRTMSFGAVLVAGTLVVIAVPCMLFQKQETVSREALMDVVESRGSMYTDEQVEASLQVVGGLLLSNQLGLAEQYIEDLQGHGVQVGSVLLCKARLQVLKGEIGIACRTYEAAKQRLTDEGENFPEEELSLIQDAASDLSTDVAMVSYLTALGEKPEDYGYEPASGNLDEMALTNTIISALEEEEKDASATDAKEQLALLVKAEEFYAAYLDGQTADETEVLALFGEFRKLMKKDELCQNRYYRLANLKVCVLADQLNAIGNYSSENVTEEELVLLTDLYIKGILEAKDLPIKLDDDFETALEVVLEQCENVMKEQKSELSKKEKNSYGQLLLSLEQRLDEGELVQLMTMMENNIDSVAPAVLGEYYLQLAKNEHYLGNEMKTDRYITEAIANGSLSEDVSFADACGHLQVAMQSGPSNEEVKSISVYVESALENSLPLQLKSSQFEKEEPEEQEPKEQEPEKQEVEEDELEETKDPGDMDDPFDWNDDTNETPTPTPTPKSEESKGDESKVNATTKKLDFTTYMSNVISAKSAIINIGAISIEAFPKVQAMVQVQSDYVTDAEDFKALIDLTDCGSKIPDYEVEKVSYNKSRIVLLTDCSGSMSYDVDALKDAVRAFANNMEEDEEVCLIGFTSDIVFTTEFSSDPTVVASYADEVFADGGTDMYDALLFAAEAFDNTADCNDIIILMTDGQDNNPASKETIYEEIPAISRDKGITIYTMGMTDDVSTEYLSQIADAGLGSFLYMDSADSLNYFYNFIHNQMQNEYRVTFTASDTTMNEREMNLTLEEEMASVSRMYYLDANMNGAGDASLLTKVEDGQAVYGLAEKKIYHSTKEQTISLRGTNLTSADTLQVSLKGSLEYPLNAAFVDDSTISLTVSSKVTPGTYDLIVVLNGNRYEFAKELTVLKQGVNKTFDFGDYHFTAQSIVVDEDNETVTLSGDVVMNSWLCFQGDVTFSGDYLNGEQLRMEDSGAYIPYTPDDQGLAGFLSEIGVPVKFSGASRTIYKDAYDSGDNENFRVDEQSEQTGLSLLLVRMTSGGVKLYPDRIAVENASFNLSLPLQEQIFEHLPESMTKVSQVTENQGDLAAQTLFTGTGIGMDLAANYENFSEDGLKLLNMDIGLKEFHLSYNSMKNDGSVEASVGFPVLPDADAFIAGLSIVDGHFDGFKLGAEGDLTFMKTPVPCTLNKFVFGASGISQLSEDMSDLEKFLNTTLEAEFEVSVAQASALVGKKITEFLDFDPAVLVFEDAVMKCKPADFNFSFDTKVTAFEILPIGEVNIQAGKFAYRNAKLNLNTTEYGISATVKVGSDYKSNNIDVTLEGTFNITAGYPYTGIELTGEVGYEVRWLVFSTGDSAFGSCLLGIYKNNAGNLQFTLDVRGVENQGELSGFQINITKNGVTHSSY